MSDNLFKNDNIVGNSKIGFEFDGIFDYDDNTMVEKLKDTLNREVSFSNIEYRLLEPTETTVVLMKDGKHSIVRTPMYNYFEAIYVMPRILELMKKLKTDRNTYIHFSIGFDGNFCDLSCLNIMKFILEFNEDQVLKNIGDVTKNGRFVKLKDLKPNSYKDCLEKVQKQVDSLRYADCDECVYGIDFSKLNSGTVVFRYTEGIDYREKWEGILKSLNHTILTIYNATKFGDFTDDEMKRIDKLNDEYSEYEKSFRCVELFTEKYKSVKITSDMKEDKSVVDIAFPSIKEKLFDIVVCNGIEKAEINYDSDISRLQVKGIKLDKCYHLNGIDIVESEISNSLIRDCDIYDTKIAESRIRNCNLFGYGDCKDSTFTDCFISRNIEMKDCDVSGKLGKMAGSLKGKDSSIRNTTILKDTAEIGDEVEMVNVTEMM